jgi:Tfp pilus assembly protein PilV
MIEMLMTTFVLAVGLLGLCMLQTMSLRASTGSRSLATAVHVANSVMDQVEMEGRLSWLNLTNSAYLVSATSPNTPLTLSYITAKGGTVNASFDLQGNVCTPGAADVTLSNPYYTVTTVYVDDVGSAGGVGKVSDFTVTVAFSDTVNGAAVPRQVVLTRRILHG